MAQDLRNSGNGQGEGGMSECPKKNLHTESPEGYLAWQAWAEKKHKRYYQVICDGCGLYEIWKQKENAKCPQK